MKSLAAILVELKTPLEIAEVEVPPLGVGQVLVKVLCSGICGSQIGEIDGAKGPDRFLPHLLGHEGGGIVLETGPGVKSVRKDDRVVLHWRKGAGIEADPPKYRWGARTVNAGWVTTFNEYAVVSENRVTAVPPDLDPEIAALMGCAVMTGLGVVVNNARLALGESIVVMGAGGVGLNVIQGAALTSAYPIIAVDLVEERLALARELGATHTFNAKTASVKDEVAAIVGMRGADVVVETTGNTDVIELSYELAGPRSRIVLVGVPRKGHNVSIYTLPLHFGKVLTGSHGGEANPAEDIPRYVRLVKSGRLAAGKVISGRFGLREINKALDLLRNGEIAGRCMISM